jgi:hypothetical protein
MTPTLVFRDGQPVFTLGSPGGATIITTVLQILLNRLDLGMTLPEAIAAPRASQRNTAITEAEPEFLNRYEAALKARGHQFSTNPEIGTATGLEFFHSGRVVAARRAGAPWWRQCSGGASPLIARDAMRADRGGERRTATGSRRKHDRQGAISDDAQDQLPLAVFGGPLVAQWDWFSGETTRRRLRYTRVS